MATGVVSGAVALMSQAAPNLTPDQLKALLMRDANHTVFPQVSSVTDPVSGPDFPRQLRRFHGRGGVPGCERGADRLRQWPCNSCRYGDVTGGCL